MTKITFEFGIDKRKTKEIEKLLKEIQELKKELRVEKKYSEGLEVEKMKLKRRNTYLERKLKVGKQNDNGKQKGVLESKER